MTDDNSDLSSSDSDEEFLTAEKQQDREALVRKKLLESFYGKSSVKAAAAAQHSFDDDDDDDDDDEHDKELFQKANKSNLDSPYFDAVEHTVSHVTNDSVQELLEQEEQLALQVRTLDSTMQTLVYENYTRFIDATDAIRSIGVNVQANEAGLTRLTAGIDKVDEKSKAIEDALGTLRDQVAEKIRIKRLLKRLDALLRLPQTLQQQITAGKYRTATKSYLQAASVLGKHSAGFESLKNIETECTTILAKMKKNLLDKVLHWSGRRSEFDQGDEDSSTLVPGAPKNMAEIFECVGTLVILVQERNNKKEVEEEGPDVSDPLSSISIEDLQSIGTAAALRLLDRLLDVHAIDMQERRFALDGGSFGLQGLVNVPGMQATAMPAPVQQSQDGSDLVAKDFLSALLKGATLFSSIFGTQEESTKTNLLELVSEAFSSFLVHTKSILVEESTLAGKQEEAVEGEGTTDEPNVSSKYLEISSALLILIKSVQELTAGLTVPEVGLSSDYAMSLVRQVSELSESMIRRRVDQKFQDLRQGIIRDCLIPFVSKVAVDQDAADFLVTTTQHANSALSNCLQLVDDTVRSILAGDLAVEEGHSDSVPDLKDAVDTSIKRFAFWLANSFELLAGGESCDGNKIAEAAPENHEEKDDTSMDDMNRLAMDTSTDNDAAIEGLDQQEEDALEKLDKALSGLYKDQGLNTDFILAIAEMCRSAQSSVSMNLEQSIATHSSGGTGTKKNNRGLFASGSSSPSKTAGPVDDITARFKLAESRVFVIFTTSRGWEAAHCLCSNLSLLSSGANSAERPSDFAVQALSGAKTLAVEVASVFGDTKRAKPVSELEDDKLRGVVNPLMGRKTGLQLDVERMFKEKVAIYPHPSDIVPCTRDASLFLFFKIAFRAMYEHSRQLRFSQTAFRQVIMDTELLRHMTSHFISESYHPGGTEALTTLSSLLSDVVDVVGDRCVEEDAALMKDDFTSDAHLVLKKFLSHDSDARSFVIDED